jgi:predicted permease
MFDASLRDVRYALRLLRRSPIFTATAVLSLAIGIGANTTIFSIASALLLRPLPGLDAPGRLVDIGRTQDGKDFDTSSYPNYLDVRARATTLSGIYAIRLEPQPMGLGGSDGAERIYGSVVTGNYFSVLGTRAYRGRLLMDRDDEGAPGSHPVMAISYALWQRRFGGDAGVVGRSIPLNGYPFTIVGVAPPGFQGTTVMRSDVWVPISAAHLATPSRDAGLLRSRLASWLMLGGRLKPGVTVAQANAELSTIGHALEREYPDVNRGRGLAVLPSAVIPGHIGVFAAFIGLLMALVAIVLLIACTNLSGMLLARAAERRRDIAVRLAIGASRWQLARQLLVETAMLFVAGCAAGLLLSAWLRGLLLALLPQLPVPLGLEMPIDARVVAFGIALSVIAALLSSAAPALQMSRPDLVPALKSDSAGAGSRLRLRSVFLVAQVAMSMLLVLTAGLFLRALGRASSIPPGFDAKNVDVVMLDLTLARYDESTGLAFARDLLSRAASRPGVTSAALVADLPLDGGRMGLGSIRTPGLRRGNSEEIDADWNAVSPGYFRTLNMTLVRGRDFSPADGSAAARVAIVNETMARAIWHTIDAIGRTIELNDGPGNRWEPATIVGVAADAHLISLSDPAEPYIYVPLAQSYLPRFSLVVKSAHGSAIADMRALVRSLNPDLPVAQALPLEQVTALGLIPQRIAGAVAGSLGIFGVLLAAIGLYGVISYTVNRRTREIGIRVALGADRSAVRRLIVRQALGLTVVGAAVGLVCGAILARVLQSLLFGVSAVDPVTFGGAVLLFVAVAGAASSAPARRAVRIDPIAALRAE